MIVDIDNRVDLEFKPVRAFFDGRRSVKANVCAHDRHRRRFGTGRAHPKPGDGTQPMRQLAPPSTGSATPVTNPASSEARYRAA